MLATHDKCTGCGACASVCPNSAITMEKNAEGFALPVVTTSCNSCGICGRACPEHVPVPRHEPPEQVYAAWCDALADRLAASSGGFFRVLARAVYKDGGVVVGAAFDEEFMLRHRSGRNESECNGFSGSKYLQSDMSGIYREVAALLDGKTKVLFSGTPCQVAGLYGYLGGDREGLVTCDIVCTGVPSPAVFRDFLSNLEKRFKSKVDHISFRDKITKKTRFTARFENGDVYSRGLFDTDFGYGFGAAMFLRESCGTCRYADTSRVGDFTLGDFWGLGIPHDKSKGVSLVMVNSEKGRTVMSALPRVFASFPRPLSEAVAGNPRLASPIKHSPRRAAFFEAYANGTFKTAARTAMPSKARRLLGKVFREVKKRITTFPPPKPPQQTL